MKFSKPTFFRGFLLLLCFLVVTSSVEAKTKVTMWLGSQVEEVKPWLDEFVAQFSADNPDIELELTIHPYVSAMREKIVVASAGGAGPDIFGEGSNVISMFVENGLARPLDEFVNKMQDKGDFIPDLLRDLTFDGSLYAIPYKVRPFADAYNTYLFQNAGADTPTTWDEMIKAAHKTTRTDSNGLVETNGYVASFTSAVMSFIDFEMYLQQLGTTTIQPGQKKADINNESGQRALQYMRDLYQNGMPDQRAKGLANFFAGSVAVYHGAALGHKSWMSAVPQSGLGDEIELKRYVGPTPSTGSVQYIASALLMNSNTTHPEEAWRVIDAMLSPQSMKRYLMAHGLELATRKSLFADGDLLSRPYVREATSLMVPPLAPFGSRHVLYSDFRVPAGDFLTRAITGELGIKTALEEAERTVDGIVAEKQTK